ncbi:MAG: efflux RND transporter permease subunit, partial [Nannocystaceae bacterium]
MTTSSGTSRDGHEEDIRASTPESRRRQRGWIERVITRSAANPWLTILLCAMLAAAGWTAVLRTPLDAIPDLAPPQVIVLGTWEGRSPELVEDQLTKPVSSALLGTPQAAYVRGQSYMGLSFVYVIFEDGVD